jgi:hypothetical protein
MNEPKPGSERDLQLNMVGVLVRREIEARILASVLAALGDEFGRERVLEIARQAIIEIAQKQGAQLAVSLEQNDLPGFAQALEAWKVGNALQLEVLEQNEAVLFFNVTRCRYAEMYQELGQPELGFALSCSRDYALIHGYNPNIQLERPQTIMEGAPFCIFRYRRVE